MRIMFKRPAQFPLPGGKMTEMYTPGVEHDIPDERIEAIQSSLLFRQMKGAGDLVFIKPTAPAPDSNAKAKSGSKPADAAPEAKPEPVPPAAGEQPTAPAPVEAKKPGRKPKA